MKKIIIVAFAVLVLGLGYRFWNDKTVTSTQQKTGTIVILNGPSASGKSSIQKEFTKLFSKPYLKIGIDNFFVGVLPEQFVIGPVPTPETPDDMVMKGVFSEDEQGPLFTLEVGPAGQRVISGMNHAIAAYAAQGNDIIVDYIAYEQAWIKELVHVLKDFEVYFVGVDVPLKVLEERERTRATSPVGHARSHYDTVHSHGIYDFRVDTSLLSSAECAAKIKEYMQTHKPQAFKKLLSK